MAIYPLDYEILKGLSSTSARAAAHQPRDQPGMVITLLSDEKRKLHASMFGKPELMARELKHREGLFFEDKGHDWDMRNGKFYFSSHAMASEVQAQEMGEAVPTADVMVVYKWMETRATINNTMDGESVLHASCRGVRLKVVVSNANDNDLAKSPKWTTLFHSPSLNCSGEDASDIALAQMKLCALAENEIARRNMLPQSDVSEEAVAHNPAPAN